MAHELKNGKMQRRWLPGGAQAVKIAAAAMHIFIQIAIAIALFFFGISLWVSRTLGSFSNGIK